MKIKVFLALLLLALPAFADVPNPDFEYVFNKLSGIPAALKYQLGSKVREAHNTAVCVYDFATSGGAIGNKNLLSTDLKTPCLLPGKAVVRNGFIDVTTTPLPTTSFISVSTGKVAADLKALTAASAFTAGQYATVPVFGTVGTYIKLTSANSITNGVNTNAYQPYISVATAALTAGHMRVFIDYAISE